MKKTTLNRKTSLSDFKAYYWLKNDLIVFCRENLIPSSGSEIEISNRIKQFLQTGKIINPKKAKTTSKFDWKNENITNNTLITDNYQNTENVRNFFIQCIGSHFKFNIDFMK